MLFSTGMELDFCTFLATYKKSNKSNIYISDEAVHSQTDSPRDKQTDRKQIFHGTTILQAGLINQVHNDC